MTHWKIQIVFLRDLIRIKQGRIKATLNWQFWAICFYMKPIFLLHMLHPLSSNSQQSLNCSVSAFHCLQTAVALGLPWGQKYLLPFELPIPVRTAVLKPTKATRADSREHIVPTWFLLNGNECNWFIQKTKWLLGSTWLLSLMIWQSVTRSIDAHRTICFTKNHIEKWSIFFILSG